MVGSLSLLGVGGFAPDVAVDFGCGVGRLLYPLASRARRVVGVDASQTMLDLARDNLSRRGADNVQLVRSPADLHAAAPRYDFLHSTLVFQHIRPAEGYAILRALVTGLSGGGIGFLHFRIRRAPAAGQVIRYLRARSRLLGRAAAAFSRSPTEAALIAVHEYNLGRILAILEESGINTVTATNSTSSGGLDVNLLFRKP